MARVPTRTAPQIHLQPMTEAKFLQTDPPPSIGDGLERMGTVLGDIGRTRARQAADEARERQAAERDELAVSAGDTGLAGAMGKLLYSGDKAWLRRTGEAAVSTREDVQRDLKEIVARYRQAMPSLRSRDMYDDIATRRQQDWDAEIAAHADAQAQVSIVDLSFARQAALAGIATATSSDAERAKNILTIEGDVFKRGLRMGRPRAEIESDRMRAVSEVHAGVVRRLIDADDAPGALAYLERHGNAIADAPERELRAGLRVPLARRQANEDVDHAIGAGTRDAAALAFSYGDPVHGAGKRAIAIAGDPSGPGAWAVPAREGVAVYPIAPGVAHLSADGSSVSVTHGDGSVSHYMGLGAQGVAEGARVTPDTVIGAVGAPATLDGTAPFGGSALRYRVEREGKPVDPSAVAVPDAVGAARARIDRMGAMDATNLRADREDWDEERRIEALREVDRRVRREERSIANTQAAARDAALTIAEGLGRGFTDVAQIPAKILSALEPDDLRRITAQADANEYPVPVAEAGSTAARLNLMATQDRAAFAKEDLRLHRHEMTESEYGDLSKLQADIRANPNSLAAATNDVIWRKVAEVVPGLVSRRDGAAQRQGLKLYTAIKREIDRITDRNRQPTTKEVTEAYEGVAIGARAPAATTGYTNLTDVENTAGDGYVQSENYASSDQYTNRDSFPGNIIETPSKQTFSQSDAVSHAIYSPDTGRVSSTTIGRIVESNAILPSGELRGRASEVAPRNNELIKMPNMNVILFGPGVSLVPVPVASLEEFDAAAALASRMFDLDAVITGPQFDLFRGSGGLHGQAVMSGRIYGNSAPGLYYFATVTGRDGVSRLAFGKGDPPPTGVEAGFGGGVPLLIEGRGVSGYDKAWKRYNESSGTGKNIVAYNSRLNRTAIFIQPHVDSGYSLSAVRSYIKNAGYDFALMFDGSSSVSLNYEGRQIVSPELMKQPFIPLGIGFRSQ